MNIWIVNPFEELPGPGRTPLRYGTLCRVLSERGHSVTWWSSDFSHLTKSYRKDPEVREGWSCELVPTPAYRSHVGFARWRSHREFAKGVVRLGVEAVDTRRIKRPDLLLVSLPPLSMAQEAFRLRNAWNCRVVLDLVDAWPETFLRLLPVQPALRPKIGRLVFARWFAEAASAYRAADAVIAVAKSFLDLPIRAGSTAPQHLTYLGGESVLERETGGEREAEGVVNFLYIGAMAKSYDLETVIEAARLLMRSQAKFQVHFAGAGPKEPLLRRKVEENEMGTFVHFHGYLGTTELKSLLAQSDVGLCPVFSDSWIAFPYKLSEYLAAGLPVLSCIKGESREVLERGDAGVWYPEKNPPALADAMRAYCESRELIRRQSANASAFAVAHLDRSKTYPELARFLEAIGTASR